MRSQWTKTSDRIVIIKGGCKYKIELIQQLLLFIFFIHKLKLSNLKFRNTVV